MTWYKLFESESEAFRNIPLMESRVILAGEHKICLSRNQEGFFAIQDACPHLGAPFSKGTLNEFGEVICPWHAYRYSLNDGRECENRSADAKIYPIRIDEKGFFIGVAD